VSAFAPPGQSGPFADQALRLAGHVSTAVASQLASRVDSEPDPRRGLDWDSILRVYLRYPDHGPGGWEVPALTSAGPTPPASPRFRLLGPDFGGEKLASRRGGSKARELERRYQALERAADR
jgi:hypothetical protein